MGSREQLCINPSIRNQPVYAQKALCHNGDKCDFRGIRSNILNHFYDPGFLPKEGLLDIEDLYAFGTKKSICPYYLTRSEQISIESQLVLMPYNYIMDPFIRKTMPFDLNECTLIIDEAHNIVGWSSVKFLFMYKLLNKLIGWLVD